MSSIREVKAQIKVLDTILKKKIDESVGLNKVIEAIAEERAILYDVLHNLEDNIKLNKNANT